MYNWNNYEIPLKVTLSPHRLRSTCILLPKPEMCRPVWLCICERSWGSGPGMLLHRTGGHLSHGLHSSEQQSHSRAGSSLQDAPHRLYLRHRGKRCSLYLCLNHIVDYNWKRNPSINETKTSVLCNNLIIHYSSWVLFCLFVCKVLILDKCYAKCYWWCVIMSFLKDNKLKFLNMH